MTPNVARLLQLLARMAYLVLVAKGVLAAQAQAYTELGVEVASTAILVGIDLYTHNKVTGRDAP